MLVRMNKAVRFGDNTPFCGNEEFDVADKLAAQWIKLGHCVAVKSFRPQSRQGREAAVIQPPETAMEETTHDASQ